MVCSAQRKVSSWRSEDMRLVSQEGVSHPTSSGMAPASTTRRRMSSSDLLDVRSASFSRISCGKAREAGRRELRVESQRPLTAVTMARVHAHVYAGQGSHLRLALLSQCVHEVLQLRLADLRQRLGPACGRINRYDSTRHAGGRGWLASGGNSQGRPRLHRRIVRRIDGRLRHLAPEKWERGE